MSKETEEQQKEYSDLERAAITWLDETDVMQFSQMELLTMFSAHLKADDYWQGQCAVMQKDYESLMAVIDHKITVENCDVLELVYTYKENVDHGRQGECTVHLTKARACKNIRDIIINDLTEVLEGIKHEVNFEIKSLNCIKLN